MTEMKITTDNAVETIELGQAIGRFLKGGEVLRLIGDVGAGKTTLMRGIAQGIESHDHVSSPTFTVHKLYKGRIKLYHYDFYRVQDDAFVARELEEIMHNNDASVVMEWPEFSQVSLPITSLDINIQMTDDHQREFIIDIPENMAYIKLR